MYNDIYNKEQFAYERNTLLKWLEMAINHREVEFFFHKNGFKKIAVYGVRGFGELFYKHIKKSSIEIACFVDRDHASYPEGVDGIPVYSIKELSKLYFDAVVVTPVFYFNDILNNLADNGVDLNKIVSLNMVVTE